MPSMSSLFWGEVQRQRKLEAASDLIRDVQRIVINIDMDPQSALKTVNQMANVMYETFDNVVRKILEARRQSPAQVALEERLKAVGAPTTDPEKFLLELQRRNWQPVISTRNRLVHSRSFEHAMEAYDLEEFANEENQEAFRVQWTSMAKLLTIRQSWA